MATMFLRRFVHDNAAWELQPQWPATLCMSGLLWAMQHEAWTAACCGKCMNLLQPPQDM